MAAITYRHDGLEPFRIAVKVDGKVAGYIRRDPYGGYYYRTRTGQVGQAFATVDEVKKSLEGDD